MWIEFANGMVNLSSANYLYRTRGARSDQYFINLDYSCGSSAMTIKEDFGNKEERDERYEEIVDMIKASQMDWSYV